VIFSGGLQQPSGIWSSGKRSLFERWPVGWCSSGPSWRSGLKGLPVSGWKKLKKEVMNVEQQAVVLEILHSVGVYGAVRERVSNDKDLVSMFVDRFEDLVSIMEQPPRSRVQGGRNAKEVNNEQFND
jgi:hypothetical protein